MTRLAGLVAIACSLAPSFGAGQTVAGGKYAIQTVKGNYLTAVNGGGISGRSAVNSDATRASGWETLVLVPQSDGTMAIQTATRNFWTAIDGGGIGDRPAINTNATVVSGWEKFAFMDVGGGYYAIRTIGGRYLTAVNGGGIGSTGVAIHSDATQVNGWEKFKLVRLDLPSCNASITTRRWYLDSPAAAFYPIPDKFTWAGREVSYGDPNRREYWGPYKCVGPNTWSFWNDYGTLVRTVSFQPGTTPAGDRLFDSTKNQVWHP
jgi:hypothetical protein